MKHGRTAFAAVRRRHLCGVTTLLPLEAEAGLATSPLSLQHDPCSVASCAEKRATTVELRIGSVRRTVPLCPAHAEHWVGRRP